MNAIDIINPYAIAMRLRRKLYRIGILPSKAVSIPVISVGNLSAGGTGKTPVTLYLATLLTNEFAAKVAIVLRGYKRKSKGLLIVKNAGQLLATVEQSGDEAQLYANELPNAIVICDEDRVRAAEKAQELGATVILLDDGFQHQRLKRDLDIVLINATEGIPTIIPFGKGREPLTALGDADAIIVMNLEGNTHLTEALAQTTGKPVMSGRQVLHHFEPIIGEKKAIGAGALKKSKVLVLSGIGNPSSFEESIEEVTSSIETYRLEDHAEYSANLLQKINDSATSHSCMAIVTTTKDAVKIKPLLQANPVFTVPLLVACATVQLNGGLIKQLLQRTLTER